MFGCVIICGTFVTVTKQNYGRAIRTNPHKEKRKGLFGEKQNKYRHSNEYLCRASGKRKKTEGQTI